MKHAAIGICGEDGLVTWSLQVDSHDPQEVANMLAEANAGIYPEQILIAEALDNRVVVTEHWNLGDEYNSEG